MAAIQSRHQRGFLLGLGLVAVLVTNGCQTVQKSSDQAESSHPAAAGAIEGAGTRTTSLAVRVMDAGQAPDAGFLPEPERLVTLDRSQHPFQRVWVAPNHSRERYSKIEIAAIDLGHQLENSRWSKMSTASFFGLEDDVDRLAIRLAEKIEDAFRNDPQHRFQVVTEPDAETLILEIALVEVVPNKSVVALGALAAIAAPPAISLPLGTFANRTEHGYVAIEGRLRDGETGEIVVMFADRETAKTRIIDIQSLHWYGHAFEIFDEWAAQLVEVANRPLEPGIADSAVFTLYPW
jgi:hypothetical protein